MTLLANLQSVGLFLAGVALLTFILMKRSYRYFAKQRRKRRNEPALEQLPRPTSAWDGGPRDSMAHIERQKVEMYDMARDLNGQLSSRIVVLEKLIGDSQRQIERMEKLLGQIEDAQITPEASSSIE